MYEHLHMFANLLAAIIIPLVLLIFMSVSIVWKLNISVTNKPKFSPDGKVSMGRFGTEKRTVVRITLITTFLQLLGELPSVPVFAFASIFGPATTSLHLCTWQTLSQFMGIINISLSFFVYLIFSPRFRKAILTYVF